MTLVILAAGLATRYGGLKQADAFGKNGEFIIDYSIYDAMCAGFDKIVLIIRKEHLDVFRSTLEKRINGRIEVEYVFQDSDNIPQPYCDIERKKPWGTCHALLCCKGRVNDDFAVINADDFYGRDAFIQVASFLKNKDKGYCMAGYILKNTLSKNGFVTRGLCVENNGMLEKITECKGIMATGTGAAYTDASGSVVELDVDSTVSMNFWGFRRDIFGIFDGKFSEFLGTLENEATDEYCISTAIDDSIKASECTVEVLKTNAKWLGVTYAADKEPVQKALNERVESGEYPENLFA